MASLRNFPKTFWGGRKGKIVRRGLVHTKGVTTPAPIETLTVDLLAQE